MKKLLTAFAAIVLLASCQKEIILNPNNPAGAGLGNGSGGSGSGSTTGSGLLVKAVAVTGAETLTTLYAYDAQKRLESINTTGTAGGFPADTYQKFIRDGAGRITTVLQKLPDIAGTTSDTARLTYHYPNTTTMEPDNSVSVKSLGAGGFTLSNIDSSVYNYSGGKLVSYNGYMFTDMLGMRMPLSESRWEYTYNPSGYVTAIKTFTNTNSGDPLTETYNVAFTYGTLTNNTYASASAMQNFILYGTPNTSAPALIKLATTSVNVTPAVQATVTTNFTTAGNKITGATANTVSSGEPNRTTVYTFYYQ